MEILAAEQIRGQEPVVRNQEGHHRDGSVFTRRQDGSFP